MEKNILEWYNKASEEELKEGKAWYWEANKFARKISKKYNKPVMVVAGVIAACSAMKSWTENMRIVDLYFQGIYKHTEMVVDKCRRIDKAKSFLQVKSILGGMKTINFFDNILHPNNPYALTIDRHIIKVATGEYLHTCTNKKYVEISKAFKNVAKELNVIPSSIQGTVWLTYRKNKMKRTNTKD